MQRIIETFIALVALACAVGGHGLPLNVLGSLVIGWGMTAVVRLVFGSPLGLPSAGDVRLLLEELGIRARDVRPLARQVWGVARFDATETGRTDAPARLGIAVYGRDAADARLLTKAGRFVLYRDSGPSLTVTRLQQIEHEAYLTLRAAQISDAMLDDLYRQLMILRKARIAHGAISGDTLLADPAAQAIVLADFRNGSASAQRDRLDHDTAGVLAATAIAVGAERAGDAAADATAAVFIQRLFTSYLPPIWGWAVLVWMRKKEYL